MKRLLIVLSLILPSLSTIAAPPPPPGSNNATPIDAGIWLVLIVGSMIGSYRIYSSIHKTSKAK